MEKWYTAAELLPNDGDEIVVDDGFGQEHEGEFNLTASGENAWPSNDGRGHDDGDIKWKRK